MSLNLPLLGILADKKVKLGVKRGFPSQSAVEVEIRSKVTREMTRSKQDARSSYLPFNVDAFKSPSLSVLESLAGLAGQEQDFIVSLLQQVLGCMVKNELGRLCV